MPYAVPFFKTSPAEAEFLAGGGRDTRYEFDPGFVFDLPEEAVADAADGGVPCEVQTHGTDEWGRVVFTVVRILPTLG